MPGDTASGTPNTLLRKCVANGIDRHRYLRVLLVVKGVMSYAQSNDHKYIRTDSYGHKTRVERGLAHLDVAAAEMRFEPPAPG